MQGIKLVTFDATNTFLRFKIPPWQYYTIVARDYGYTVESDVLKGRMKESFKVMEQKHPNFGKKDVTWEQWWKELVKLTFQDQLPKQANVSHIAHKLIAEFKTARCWTVADGSEKLLNLLKERQISAGVVSNFDPRLIDILHNIGLHDSFDFILTSYDAGFSKPDKRIFDSAMKAYNAPINCTECLHIGDDVKKDYEGAKDAGWHALLIATTTDTIVENPNHVFRSIEQFYQALKENKVKL